MDGELATLSGTSVEANGSMGPRGCCLPQAERRGNHRIYEAAHAERLTFIRHCCLLDMTLDEIRLRLREAPSQTCAEVNQLLDAHIGHVTERMRELRSLEKQLKALRKRCREGSTASECEILNQLNRAAGAGGRRPKSGSHVQGVHGHNV